MKIFANENETAFFLTDDYVKNLHPIEIKTIEDFVWNYNVCDPLVLMHNSYLVAARFDELVVVERDKCDVTDANIVECDFCIDMAYSSILVEILGYYAFEHKLLILEELKQSFTVKSMWIQDEDIEIVSIDFAGNDKLTIKINHAIEDIDFEFNF